MTDPTSGFRGVNRRAIRLFAVDYPRGYPEAEANVLIHRHRMRMIEVPVAMRTRAGGRSSITVLRSLYYMVKVCLALLISMFRRYRPGKTMTPLRVSILASVAALILLLAPLLAGDIRLAERNLVLARRLALLEQKLRERDQKTDQETPSG
jgi:hypothetical protein